MNEIILVPLAQNPALGAEPLAWSLALWGRANPWFTAADWPTFYQRCAAARYDQWSWGGVDQEQMYIALSEGEVVGAIALVDFDDLEDFRELKPWVAAFVVDPARRGEGLGTKMLALLEERASTFGIEQLYLWTEDKKDFYLNRGYLFHVHKEYSEIAVDLLSKKI